MYLLIWFAILVAAQQLQPLRPVASLQRASLTAQHSSRQRPAGNAGPPASGRASPNQPTQSNSSPLPPGGGQSRQPAQEQQSLPVKTTIPATAVIVDEFEQLNRTFDYKPVSEEAYFISWNGNYTLQPGAPDQKASGIAQCIDFCSQSVAVTATSPVMDKSLEYYYLSMVSHQEGQESPNLRRCICPEILYMVKAPVPASRFPQVAMANTFLMGMRAPDQGLVTLSVTPGRASVQIDISISLQGLEKKLQLSRQLPATHIEEMPKKSSSLRSENYLGIYLLALVLI